MTIKYNDRRLELSERTVNVADAKKRLSELLGRVAYGKELITITKRGKPMARLVPAEAQMEHLAAARGWMDEGDEFFARIDTIMRNRSSHVPRILAAGGEDEGPA